MKVLVVKMSSMGDVIHTLPALSDAMEAVPGITFDWVVEEGFREIPGWHPAVQDVLPVALRRWRRSIIAAVRSGEAQRFWQGLRKQRYDAIIDAQGLLKSAALVVSRARGTKFGFDAASAREPLAARFYDHRLTVARRQHAVERTRQLFGLALGYAVPAAPGRYRVLSDLERGATHPNLVFLHGTTDRRKHWPEAHWRALAERANREGWQVKLPWGTPAERQRAETMAQEATGVEVLPRMSLTELAGVLAQASAVVSVDTGLSHLAAALDRPNLTLFGPTDPALVGGYGGRQTSLVAPSTSESADGSLASLTPEMVWSRLRDALASPDWAEPHAPPAPFVSARRA